MDRKGFSVGEVLKFGFEEWKKNWLLWLGITLFAVLIPMLPQVFLMNISEDAIVPRLGLQLVRLLLTVLIHMGILTVAIMAAKEQVFSFSDFFSKFHLFPSYLLGKILFLVGMIIGLFLLIVPGVIFALKFNLWPFFVLDRDAGGVYSLKESNKSVEGAKWDILMFWIAAILLNIFGFLLLGIGFLITWPVTLIAWSKIYLKLTTVTDVVVREQPGAIV
jgi:uncharacterized membrane protein